jgi:hypothetical protein
VIPKETYEQELKRLDEKLAAAIKEQGTPSLFEGWDPAADADDTEMSVFNGGKKKSKRTKSKKSKKSKSKKSKRTKK